MLFQLSEIEFAVIDSLADGAEPLSLMLRELREATPPRDSVAVVTALGELMEKQLARCIRTPSGTTFTNPTRDVLKSHLSPPADQSTPEYWFELTETGQTVWENWRQLRQS
ncbi:MAG: hypothetical protein ACYDBB_20885 [Armatimonadota bacterium]